MPLSGATASGGLGRLSGVIGKAGLVGAIASFVLMLPAVFTGIQDWIAHLQGLTPEVDTLAAALQNLNDKQADNASRTVAGAGGAFGTAATTRSGQYDPTFGAPGAGTVPGLALPSSSDTNITAGMAAVNQVVKGQQVLAGQALAAGADVKLASTELDTWDQTLAKLAQGGDMAAFNAALAVFHGQMQAAGVSSDYADEALTRTKGSLSATGDQSLATAAALATASDETDDAGAAFKSYIDDIYGSSIASQQLTSDLGSLGAAYEESGASAAFTGSAMTSVLNSIYNTSSSSADAAGKILGLYNALHAAGYGTAQDLQGLLDLVTSLSGGSAVAAQTFDISPFVTGLQDAKEQADGTTDAIRTLEDYADDLSGVLSRAFDLRFGNQLALDQITSQWHDMRDSASEATDKVRDLKAELRELRADLAVNEYFLSVAEKYGDTLRAGQIRADIAKNRSDIAGKNGDLADARAASDRSLTGTSDAAIDNRSKLTDLIGKYQDYLVALAKSGASQDTLKSKAAQLKDEFIKNATQMGYNRGDVTKLAASFDDMSQIISAVPRNVDVDVSANTNPALAAIREFDAKMEEQSKKHYSAGVVDPPSVDQKAVRRVALEQKIAGLKVQLEGQMAAGNYRSSLGPQIDALEKQLASGNYRPGGYTGNVPAWQIAGVVHGDEFVLNSRAQRMFPRQMLEAANHGVAPVLPRVIVKQQAAASGPLSLGRTERTLLARAGSSAVSLSADQFGRAMDGAFVRQGQRGAN